VGNDKVDVDVTVMRGMVEWTDTLRGVEGDEVKDKVERFLGTLAKRVSQFRSFKVKRIVA
jgi:hypothetical protein